MRRATTVELLILGLSGVAAYRPGAKHCLCLGCRVSRGSTNVKKRPSWGMTAFKRLVRGLYARRYDYCVVVDPVVPVEPVVPVDPGVPVVPVVPVPLMPPVVVPDDGGVVCGAGDGIVTEPSAAGVAVLVVSSALSQAARAAEADRVRATSSARFMVVSLKL